MNLSEERAAIGRTLAIAKDRNAIQISLSKNANVFLTSLRDSRGQEAFGPNVSRIQMRSTGFFFSSLGSAGFVFRQALSSWCQGGCWQFQDQNVHAVPERERGRLLSESTGKTRGVLSLDWYVSQHRLLRLW